MNMNASDKLQYLLQPDSQRLLEAACLDARDDLTLSESPLLRGLPAPRRIAILEQRKLRAKALRKCPAAMNMLFTPLGLEQITHAELSKYKSGRFSESIGSIADLCCGLGGDSLYIPPRIKVVGVDRSREVLHAYRYNVGRNRIDGTRAAAHAWAVQGDVERAPVRADAAMLDPSRRTLGRTERWQDEDMSPGWDAMERLISRYGNMAIKLGPGIPFPSFLEEFEWEYLGLKDECLEATVWTGELGRPGLVKATELPQRASIEAFRADIPDSFGRTGEPGAYLFEPVKAVVRAHLFGVLASRHGLWQIDPRIAYLSGDNLVRSPMLKAYKLIKQLPYDLKAVKEFLRTEQVGRLEIKKRGLNLIPEEVRASLKLSGENSGTLIFTKVMDVKAAFWTQAVSPNQE